MARERSLSGAAHDIAHHAGSGLGYLTPHLARALWGASLETTAIELLEDQPYPRGVAEMLPLRLALQTLRETALNILEKYGFARADVLSIKLHGAPEPWDNTGYILDTRAVITSTSRREFDSGWLRRSSPDKR